jgi:hypothetical protein
MKFRKQDDEATNKISSHKMPSHFSFPRELGLIISKQKIPSPTKEKNKNGMIAISHREPKAEQIKMVPK